MDYNAVHMFARYISGLFIVLNRYRTHFPVKPGITGATDIQPVTPDACDSDAISQLKYSLRICAHYIHSNHQVPGRFRGTFVVKIIYQFARCASTRNIYGPGRA